MLLESNCKISQLIKSIHKAKGLREWVTFESVAVEPYCSIDQDGIRVWTLLAVQQKDGSYRVWAYICWKWPTGELVNSGDIYSVLDEKNLNVTSDELFSIKKVEEVDQLLDLNMERKNSAFSSGLSEKTVDIYKRLLKTIEEKNSPLKGESVAVAAGEQVDFGQIMLELKKLVKEMEEPILMQEWSKVLRAFSEKRFSVGVVGEFSRGKSTLINKMFEKKVVPVGVLPTTTVVTKISYGDIDKAMMVMPNGMVKEMPFDEEKISNEMANFTENQLVGCLHLRVNDSRLRQVDVELIDTPGVNDAMEERAKLAIEAIAYCDATLIVLSALSPLSLTEKNFIKEHFLLKQIPHIGVVVSHLDQVDVEDRMKILNFIQNKTAEWGDSIPVFVPSYMEGLVPSAFYQVGVEQIWDELERWHKDPELDSKRMTYRKIQIQWLVYAIVNYITVQQAQLQNVSEKNKEEKIQEKRVLDKEDLIWDDLIIKIDERKAGCIKLIHGIVNDYMKNTNEYYLERINQHPDPKVWLEKEFEKTIQKAAEGLFKRLQQTIEFQIREDAGIFQGIMQAAFNENDRNATKVDCHGVGEEVEIDASGVKYVQQGIFGEKGGYVVRVVGMAAAALFAPVIAPVIPIAGAAYVITSMVGNEAAKKVIASLKENKRNEQLVLAEEIIKNATSTYFGGIEKTITNDVRVWYENFKRDVENRKKRWEGIRKDAISRMEIEPREMKQLGDWEERIKQILLRCLN